jgi:hypothetical protein
MFAMIAGNGHELIKDGFPLASRCLLVPLGDRAQQLSLGLLN